MKRPTKDNWNANLYDGNHAFVSQYGESVIDLLAPKKGEKILDAGCGTGDLANQLYQRGAHVIGIDQSQNMIHQAQHKYPDIIFQVQDMMELAYHDTFDAVFSNATLHWIKQPRQALQSIYNSLHTGGRLVAELGGKGNVQLITDAIIQQIERMDIPYTQEQFPWYFPSIGEYTSLMEEVGFTVTFAHHFDRPTPLAGEDGLRNWIEMFAGSILAKQPDTLKEQLIQQVEQSLREVLYQDGQWVADYKRLRVIGVK
ncbi:class I SAM-dependent methyltransferase [Gracilibacillus phocaeensis]|uniref:class I SAM-dependent methyltransferase n=1 Tax=Gracilibacillus phocaeensis TaxID=2042304 RepID=UPI00102F6B6E|nr:class I SAM-dependent methyltransferase [Gracilibacillus phocaeensis]